jgi:hypothetical protein
MILEFGFSILEEDNMKKYIRQLLLSDQHGKRGDRGAVET